MKDGPFFNSRSQGLSTQREKVEFVKCEVVKGLKGVKGVVCGGLFMNLWRYDQGKRDDMCGKVAELA
ncbi:hypothetical protein COLO4_36787 [Corchorus olitorius]|uniref:Uncharacterized protein n=1 Tax=Corchorus olitorius TaxID=93759 RepID=A0A1R3G5C1_9ROSI|nr:hypothetical protein COLO4_36787 [Corchorus olitorius]